MPLSYTANTPLGSQTVASTQPSILTNFQSVNSAFNAPVGGVTGGGNFCSYSFQAPTTNFTAKPINPIGVLSTVASSAGNPELTWINNVNAVGSVSPFTTNTQITGGGITAAAWVQFNGAAAFPTPATINNSYNVTSVTKPGPLTNLFVVNFTRNFTNSNYAVFITDAAALVTPNTFVRSVNSFSFKVSPNASDVSVLFFGTLV